MKKKLRVKRIFKYIFHLLGIFYNLVNLQAKLNNLFFEKKKTIFFPDILKIIRLIRHNIFTV